MKCILVAAAMIVAMTSPAFANHCPRDVAIVSHSLSITKGLTEMQMTKVKALRDKGAAFHKSGNHGEAVKALHEALKILEVKAH